MEEIKLSIVVPVYNIEKYVAKCINSLLNQDVPKESYEIICVNDGSTDASLLILKDFEKFNKNVKIIDKKNGGLSSARNAGIEVATGDYICFIDGDDALIPNSLGKLYKNFGSDIIQYNFTKVEENFEENNPSFDLKNYLIERCDDLCWNKLFKLNIIKENHVMFNTDMKAYAEDTMFVMLYRSYSKTVKMLDNCFYLYRQRESSLLHFKRQERYITQINSLKILCSIGTRECLPRVEKNSQEYNFIKKCIEEDKLIILYLSPLTRDKPKEIIRFFKENNFYPIKRNKEQVKGIKKIKYKIKFRLIGLLRFRIIYYFFYFLTRIYAKIHLKFD